MNGVRIAIVGIGLCYPDANSPDELWENVLAGRRAFRRLPDERMNLEDYWSPDPDAPDRFHAEKAAVLRDFEFDRVRYRIAGSTYRSTDTTHWLALEVAARALADAGFPDGEGLPRQSTGVVIGNSLTGEFSRANVMRLRWPYVRRTVAAALAERGWASREVDALLHDLEARYKAPFPPIDEDTLAGGLSNTIAGRVCNHFDLKGGGYTVDGACSSSLLSVVTAARALADGDLDVALAGGVDLSIDPFEVVGFAKTGALATGEMRVYDRASNGFWPGEGAGTVVLMREEDALAHGARIYASIAGWAVSSDGRGGITRPEAAGHRLALDRAYRRAGYGIETVAYFEGHGTGTALGDATEIEALSSARRAADPAAAPAALGSIKANLGHTKAAAGVAGLIKTALAVHHQVIPPATGHHDPHPLLGGDAPALYVPHRAEPWPSDRHVRAGVSAMGFGGVNTHITVEQAPAARRRGGLDARTVELVAGRQDAELLLLAAADRIRLRERVDHLAELAPTLALAELADLAGALAAEASGGTVRAAVVARDPTEAAHRLERLRTLLDNGTTSLFDTGGGIFLDHRTGPPRITYLFPGQGSGRGTVGAIRRRFTVAEDTFRAADLPAAADQTATQVAQPRIVTGSLAALRVLAALGIDADTAVGHSLGELTALHWGGAISADRLTELAADRGRAMAAAGRAGGAMAGIAADPDRVRRFLRGTDAVIAGYNGPAQTVVSGPAADVARVCEAARAAGAAATRLDVSHAFHSPLVAPAADVLAERLARTSFRRLERPVVSTVTGDVLDPDTDLRALLRDQIVRPVRFHEAAARAVRHADLVLEVGPGRVLTGLAAHIAPDVPVLPVDTESGSLAGLLSAVGAAYVLGAPVNTGALFSNRAVRPLPLDRRGVFLASPCEAAPVVDTGAGEQDTPETPAARPAAADVPAEPATLELLRRAVAERAELPPETVGPHTRPLDDLHLSSITVGQIVNETTRRLGRPALEATSSFATLSLGELARVIDELAETARDGDGAEDEVPGVAPWVRAFSVDHVESSPPGPVAGEPGGDWEVYTTPGHPLAEPLRTGLAAAGLGGGVLLCLPADCGEEHTGLLLAAARAAVAGGDTRLVVVQYGLGASGLARTVHLEAPRVTTTLVDLADVAPRDPGAVGEAVRRVVAETAATTGFTEVRYDAAGVRTVPRLRVVDLPEAPFGRTPLDERDVLLVTGGGKGITAECALAVARESGARLVLLGRADPADDAELAANLERMAEAGVEYRYERADVTCPEQVRAAVARAGAELGPVTAVLHGAGRNEPTALTRLTEEEFHRTLAPKTGGLRAVLDAVDPDRLGLLITFGSIIGRAGLRGEAHYATANDRMTELALRFGRQHPHTRVVALEWSVWSGAGMGERLGAVEALRRDGITPISAEDGIAVLRQVLADPSAGPLLVVSGRTGTLPTLAVQRRERPLHRFTDRVVVDVPGVELVAEADLSAGSDPYLDDHLLAGEALFPAVLGMEAMVQAAAAVTGHDGPPLLEDVEFLRPVVVRQGGPTTVRLAALVRGPGTVEVVLRSEETGFGADHFRATVRFPRPALSEERPPPAVDLPAVPLDPVTELYGGVLFQGKRFQRLLAYRHMSARRAVAEVATGSSAPWFATFLPQDRLLADPGTRDAVMHALQVCVPDATLLPRSVARLHLAVPAEQDTGYVVLDARERSRDGDSHTYDVDVRDASGGLVERWEGLVLHAVARRGGAAPWAPALLGPHLERELERVLGVGCAAVVEPDPPSVGPAAPADRRAQTGLAASRALGRPVRVRHRPDGRPELDGVAVSASHGAGLTLVLVGTGRLACDVETALDRGEQDWADLLGPGMPAVRDLLASEAGDSPAVAGTRVWGALECLRKAGTPTRTLVVDRIHPDGWAVLSSGRVRIATWAATVDGRPDPVVFAVLCGEER